MTVRDYKNSDNLCEKGYRSNGFTQPTRSYMLWTVMNTRCKVGGSVQKRLPTYIGCTTSKNFKDFQYFAEWCQNQVGYGLPGYQLDKDVLITGNKMYSEDTCVFVPQSLNRYCSTSEKCRGLWPRGVTRLKGKFHSVISIDGKNKLLGIFETPEEAAKMFLEAKSRQTLKWVEKYNQGILVLDSRVIDALVKLAEEQRPKE